MAKTKIEWCDYSWSPITGCSKLSDGCTHCFAETMTRRFTKEWKPWTKANAAHNVRLHPDRLDIPLHWRKPRKVFVVSMGDLFHDQVPDAFIERVFDVMREASQHSFQILTKRPKRMLEFIAKTDGLPEDFVKEHPGVWPIPNVWLGVSAEDQKTADERIPLLLQTPAAKKFISIEPMLGPIDFTDGPLDKEHSMMGEWSDLAFLDWIVVGGESGPKARPMHPDWVRSVRDQCQEAGAPFFFKGWGEWLPDNQTEEPFVIKPGHPGAPKWAINKRVMHLSPGLHAFQVGKKHSGRLLDGREWSEFPK